MKRRIQNIVFILGCMILCCCSSDDDKYEGDTDKVSVGTRSAFLSADVALASTENENYVSTLRILVFDDASTGSSVTDVNQVMTINEKAESLHALLTVKANDDIAVAAIINEPASLKPMLDNIFSLSQLEHIVTSFADVFNSNYTDKNGSSPVLMLPMSGMKRGIVVTDAHNSEAKACKVDMHVDRCVAKVTFFAQTSTAVPVGEFKINAGSQLTLYNTYDCGYIAAGTEEDNSRFQSDPLLNYGPVQTVEAGDLNDITWTVPSDINLTTTPQKIVSFYMSERTCETNENRLKVNITKVKGGPSNDLRYTRILSRITDNKSTEKDFSIIRRNFEYQIYCTFGIYDMNLVIQEWNLADVRADILGTYFDLSATRFTIPASGGVDIDFKTDAAIIYMDWSNLTGVQHVGTYVNDNITSVNVVGGSGTIHLDWESVSQPLSNVSLVFVAGNIRRNVLISGL